MSSEARPLLPTWAATALLLIAAAAASAVIVVLAQQNRQLRSGANSSPQVPALQVGDILPDLPLTGLTGAESRLHDLAGSGVTVVGLMTTTCEYCRANLSMWRELSDQLETNGVTFNVLSLDAEAATREYEAEHGLSWPIWLTDLSAARGRMPPLRVPTTLVVDGSGEMLSVSAGVLSDRQLEEIVIAARHGE